MRMPLLSVGKSQDTMMSVEPTFCTDTASNPSGAGGRRGKRMTSHNDNHITHTCTCIIDYLCMYIVSDTHIHMHTQSHTHIHTRTHTHTLMHTHMHTHTHTHTHTHAHTHAHTYAHTHTYTHTHTHTHMHTHTCPNMPASPVVIFTYTM